MAFGKLRGARLGVLRPRLCVDNARAGTLVYNSQRWKDLVRAIRRVVRACMACGATGCRLYVDHIVELEDGGEPYALSNLCVLCASCHGKKTHAVRLLRAGITRL